MASDASVRLSWSLLRYSYGAVILLAGLDKVFATNLIVAWPQYISPFVLGILPVSVPVFLIAMGVIEVVVGLMLLTKFPRIAAYLTVAWLVLISVNLVLGGHVDVAIRDLLLAIGAFVIAKLSVPTTHA